MSAGIYLKTLRDRQHLTRAEIAKRTGVSVQTISNIENGDKETRGSVLFAFADAVNASLEHLRRLMLGVEDESEAYRLAEMRLSRAQLAQIDATINEIGVDEVARFADRVLSNPDLLAELVREVVERDRQRR